MLRNIGKPVRNFTYTKCFKLQFAARFLSTLPSQKVRDQNQWKFLPEKDLQDYMDYLPKFIEDVTAKEVMLGHEPVNQRLRNVLEYMGPKGKHLRQHLLIYTYKTIENHYGTFSPEKMEDVYRMSWCLELLNKGNTIMDDYLDDHDTRSGKPTWLKKVGEKLSIMDLMLIRTSIPGILRKYFGHHPRIHEMLNLFLGPETVVSLVLELETRTYEKFTMKRCEDIAMLKTVFYVCDQPFMLATLLANKGLHMNQYAKKALRYLGLLYSMQNDVLDVYGEEIGGKPCSDIKDDKCSYLIAMAFEKASSNQKKILKENYGKSESSSIGTVKEIYEDLDILGEYYKMEQQYLEKSVEEIRKIPDGFARSLIEKIAYVQSYGEIGVPPY